MRRSQALTRLKRMTAWENDPALTENELADLLDFARVPDMRGALPRDYDEVESGVEYAAGTTIVPAYADWTGYKYVCTTGGTTAGDGTWGPSGGTVTDGDAVFEDAGAATWIPTYDLNLAAAEGWRWKKAASAGRITFTADGATFNRDQFLAHCEAMIATYAPAFVGTGRVRRNDE